MQDEFKLSPAIFHLAVHFLIRYIEKNKAVERKKIQLVGLLCIELANKQLGTKKFTKDMLLGLCAGTYTANDYEKMEGDIWIALEFLTMQVTAWDFVDMWVSAVVQWDKTKQLTAMKNTCSFFLYIAVCNLVDMISVDPHLLAAACLKVGCDATDFECKFHPECHWCEHFVNITTCNLDEIQIIAGHDCGDLSRKLYCHQDWRQKGTSGKGRFYLDC